MKHKSSALIATVLFALGMTLLAAQKGPVATNSPKLIRLKSNGDNVGELRLPQGTPISVSAKQTGYDEKTGRQTAEGSVSIKIWHHGRLSVVVKAEEMEMVSE